MQTAPIAGADAARFFDRFATDFDTLYDGKRGPIWRWVDRRFRSDMFVRFALTFEAFGELRDKTLIDIGCGSGPYLLEALKRGATHVTGVDPAPGMLSLARTRLGDASLAGRFTLVDGLFPGVTLKPADFAMVMGVMDYVANAEGFLRALRPLVKRLAAISFPSRHWFRTPLRKARYRLRRCPLYFYDEQTINRLARGAGFGSVTIRKIPGAGLDYHACLSP
jgi:SAM-dependent methyltransferase